MEKVQIGVDGITAAIKARKILRDEGVVAKVLKTTAALGGGGCSHVIEMRSEDFFYAASVLRRAEINYRFLEK